jgi:hypothetical protein
MRGRYPRRGILRVGAELVPVLQVRLNEFIVEAPPLARATAKPRAG